MIGGLDLSLTSTGMVAVPERWGCVWSGIAVARAGRGLPKTATEAERLKRIGEIRDRVVAFVREYCVRVCVVEQYAFSARASHAHALGELGGVVKLALQERCCEVVVVSPAAARKLLGKQPRSQAKVWAAQRLFAAGAPKTWTLDQVDAFVVANHYLSEIGGDAIMLPEAA